jgi:hypothetical protein
MFFLAWWKGVFAGGFEKNGAQNVVSLWWMRGKSW